MAVLAEVSGVGLSTIWRIEQGVPCYWVTIRKLAGAFGVHPRELANLRKGGIEEAAGVTDGD